MMSRHLAILCCALVVALLSGCSDDPLERTLERMQALTALLEEHKEDEPEVLLDAFEDFVDENEAGFAADRDAFEALDDDERAHLRRKHEKELAEVLDALLDVTVEIQDRLSDVPDKLVRFIALLRRLR